MVRYMKGNLKTDLDMGLAVIETVMASSFVKVTGKMTISFRRINEIFFKETKNLIATFFHTNFNIKTKQKNQIFNKKIFVKKLNKNENDIIKKYKN